MSCPKCNGDMEAGFVPDFSYGSVFCSSWVEGDAEKGWLGGVKTKNRTKIAITTYRCTNCGFLESYAQP